MSIYINERLSVENRLGQVGVNNKGEEMKIIVYRSSKDIDIQFKDGVIVENKNYSNFLKGSIAHPIKYEESLAYYIEVELGLNINEIWNFEKNIVSPYEIYKQSNQKVWILCQEKDYHNDNGGYEVSCNNFYRGKRCGYCASRKIHKKDSFAQWGIDTFGEEFLDRYWSKKNTIDPWSISVQSNNQKVWILCQEKDYHNDNGGYEVSCYNFYRGNRCGYCNSKKVHIKDSLGYLHLQIAQMIISDKRNNMTMEDMYKITPYNTKKFYFKCDRCGKGSEEKKKLQNIVRRNYPCEYCSDGISIPNKILRQISEQLDLNLKFEHMEDWLGRKRLDGYDDNFRIAIEMDGNYGNHEENEDDKWKDEQCLKYGIYVVRIDLTNDKEYYGNTFEYIKKQILNSSLALIYDFSNFNWELAWENSLKSLVWEVKKLFEKGYTNTEIAKILNISSVTVRSYERQLGIEIKTQQEIYQENLLKAKELFQQRKTNKEVAKILGVSKTTIFNYKKELNL